VGLRGPRLASGGLVVTAATRRGLLVGAAGALLAARHARARVVTDAAGRAVALPERVGRVFVAGPPASVFVYALAPEKLLGWTREFRGRETLYVTPAAAALPVLGRLTGRGGDANLEAVLAARPDLILDVGSTTPTYVSLAERVQAQTGIRYVLVDGRFGNTVEALRLLGDVLGVPEQAGRLAAYAEAAFAEADAVLAAVPEDRRPRTYLARGPEGLEAGVRGSINAEIIERAGGRNVADAPGQEGIATVSLERVLAWDPEVVVTWDPQAHAHVRSSPLWAGVRAVRDGRVRLSPSDPFGWIDRPPSLNRRLGLSWLAATLHPDRVRLDLPAATREFYSLSYHVDLDRDRLDRLLQGALG
jgi:iron complex transport system substrate-binding protein